MKDKKFKRSIVHYTDQKPKRIQNKKQNKKKAKILSMMTYCQCCKRQITKKNKVDDFYLCDYCNKLTPPEIYLQITKDLDTKALRYVNWEDDLDYLYHHFWLDDK